MLLCIFLDLINACVFSHSTAMSCMVLSFKKIHAACASEHTSAGL